MTKKSLKSKVSGKIELPALKHLEPSKIPTVMPKVRPRFGDKTLVRAISGADFSNGMVQVALASSIPYLLFITDNVKHEPPETAGGKNVYIKEERNVGGKTYYLHYTEEDF